jgi:hypothetical protein
VSTKASETSTRERIAILFETAASLLEMAARILRDSPEQEHLAIAERLSRNALEIVQDARAIR